MINPVVSVVIPSFNEAKSIAPLVQRLDTTMRSIQTPYEVIVIDDNSTDGTLQVLQQLQSSFPLHAYLKPSSTPKGKAHSLVGGFQQATGQVIVMLDADLQYPPEAIPSMLAKLSEADVIVANRVKKHTSLLRRISSTLFQKIFSGFVHGIHVDAQSGLKLFRREVIQRITLHPTAWTFDIELLVKAQHAGYRVTSVPITLSKRQYASNKTKLDIAKMGWQLSGASLKLKTKRADAIPFLPEVIAQEGYGFHYKGQKFISHSRLPAHETALYRLAHHQRFVLITIFVVFAEGLLFNWHATLIGVMALLTFLYFIDLLFNLFLIWRSFVHPPAIGIKPAEIAAINPSSWPTYTIFCPLYKEHRVIPQFVKAMSNLDYPKDKLQVMLLLEQDDTITIEKAQSMELPNYFKLVIVPHSLPKTKPKACNYGLQKATGEYCVIFDAEDVPDKDQLKKAVIAFVKAGPHIACIQAQLNFYNPHQNLLTRAFTAEYSLWFDLVLTGLQSINAPIPLGGTSNHFRTAQLKQFDGWDAFNVTEDCDLGIRLIKRGFHTAILESTTFEEANSDLVNWLRQRSRWIKGYMQTYLVHMRNPREFSKNSSEPHLFTFQLIVGGKILSMFINPVMWAITISYFLLRPILGSFIESFFPAPVLYMAVFSLVIGNFLYAYYYMIGCVRRNQDELVKFAFFVPIYWLVMSIAAWVAFKELLVRPHHWAKTHHGLHLHTREYKRVIGSTS